MVLFLLYDCSINKLSVDTDLRQHKLKVRIEIEWFSRFWDPHPEYTTTLFVTTSDFTLTILLNRR